MGSASWHCVSMCVCGSAAVALLLCVWVKIQIEPNQNTLPNNESAIIIN